MCTISTSTISAIYYVHYILYTVLYYYVRSDCFHGVTSISIVTTTSMMFFFANVTSGAIACTNNLINMLTIILVTTISLTIVMITGMTTSAITIMIPIFITVTIAMLMIAMITASTSRNI